MDSLYVHVPFCSRKCEYCAFYSETVRGSNLERYVTCLALEMERKARAFGRKTIFFGGGTPSLLTVSQWRRLLERMAELALCGTEEWTVECNPATVSREKALLLREFGVNRISMGVQSLDEGLLDRLGRVHSRDMVFRSFDVLRGAGFDNVNVDLMFAIPGQTMEIWQSTLREALALGSEHISCYEVIYEEDTPLYEQMSAGEFDVNEDLACDMYDVLVQSTADRGFHQYEIANFARGPWIEEHDLPAHACRHNVNYWRGGDFYGLGPSATGYVGGTRTRNWSSTDLYCAMIEQDKDPVESREELSSVARAGEIAAFGLRMNRGWNFERFKAATGRDLRSDWKDEMAALEHEALAERDPSGFRLTARGLRFADLAAGLFLKS